ncbi:MAG: potassium channel protein [Bryobacterales bacterium]|nr:potassium channel protein [Bryobacterales bacterium]
MQPPLRRVLGVLALISSLLISGTLGFHWVEGWTLFEGFYMTLMTLTTVGYGELHPLSSSGRIVAAALMLGGVAAVFISIGVLVDIIIKLELADYFGRKRRQRMLEELSDHYIVCGAGRVGRSVINELRRSGVPVVLVDSNPASAQWGIQEGIPTLVADATQDDTLRQARVMQAKGLVAAISSDAENVYVTLSAHVLNPALIISARATDEQAEAKLKRAGATTVLTPYTFIGHRLAQSMLRPHVLSFLDVASAFPGAGDLEIETEQLHITDTSPLCGKTLEEAHVRQTYGLIVLALRKAAGSMLFNPDGATRVDRGDVLIAMGERSKLKRMAEELRVHAAS